MGKPPPLTSQYHSYYASQRRQRPLVDVSQQRPLVGILLTNGHEFPSAEIPREKGSTRSIARSACLRSLIKLLWSLLQ